MKKLNYLLSILIAGIGGFVLLGYAAHLVWMYEWGTPTAMSPGSAICFILIGIALATNHCK